MVLSNLTERNLVSPDMKNTFEASIKNQNFLLKRGIGFPQILEENEPNDSRNSDSLNCQKSRKSNSKNQDLLESIRLERSGVSRVERESLLHSLAELNPKFKGFESNTRVIEEPGGSKREKSDIHDEGFKQSEIQSGYGSGRGSKPKKSQSADKNQDLIAQKNMDKKYSTVRSSNNRRSRGNELFKHHDSRKYLQNIDQYL